MSDDFDDLLADLDLDDEEMDEQDEEVDAVNVLIDLDEEDETEVIADTVTVSGNAEPIRRPLISGHCGYPASNGDSHRRCVGFSRANPDRIFQPCPCACHFPEERYECECGATLAEAPHYPVDEDGDVRYVHVDPKTGRMVDSECPR